MTKGVWYAVCLLLALPVGAEEEAATPPAPVVRTGWYAAPLMTYMKADSGRCAVDDGPGFAAVFGHRGDFASLELWGQLLTLSKGECTYTVPAPTMTDPDNRDTVVEPSGDVKLNGYGLSLLLGPFFEDKLLQRFYAIVGFGFIQRADHPQYAQDDATTFGDVGLGYTHPVSLFGLETNVRAELRNRYDVQQSPFADEQDPPPPHYFNDFILNLGLQFALSPKPEEPAAKPEPVAVVQAQETDADVDGVPDTRDQCPDTPLGKTVDANGCEPAPEPTPEPAALPAEPTIETAKSGDTIVLHGVNFETGSARLTANAQTILGQVAEKLAARPELRIEIGGHTDSRGSDIYNQTLSEQRAQAVMAYLTEHGIASDHLTAVGHGEGEPFDSNETDEGRERNRRVELRILEGTAPSDQGQPPA